VTEIALILGIVFVSFGFLLVARSVIDQLAEEAKAEAAKTEERNGPTLSARTVSMPGSGAICAARLLSGAAVIPCTPTNTVCFPGLLIFESRSGRVAFKVSAHRTWSNVQRFSDFLVKGSARHLNAVLGRCTGMANNLIRYIGG